MGVKEKTSHEDLSRARQSHINTIQGQITFLSKLVCPQVPEIAHQIHVLQQSLQSIANDIQNQIARYTGSNSNVEQSQTEINDKDLKESQMTNSGFQFEDGAGLGPNESSNGFDDCDTSDRILEKDSDRVEDDALEMEYQLRQLSNPVQVTADNDLEDSDSVSEKQDEDGDLLAGLKGLFEKESVEKIEPLRELETMEQLHDSANDEINSIHFTSTPDDGLTLDETNAADDLMTTLLKTPTKTHFGSDGHSIEKDLNDTEHKTKQVIASLIVNETETVVSNNNIDEEPIKCAKSISLPTAILTSCSLSASNAVVVKLPT